MKTGDIARLLGVDARTISNWFHRYQDFFSKQTGLHRTYTNNDIDVFSTIAKLLKDGFSHEDVELRLQSGERHSPDSLVGSGLITEYVPKESVAALIDSASIAAERDRLLRVVEDLTHQLEVERQDYKSTLESEREQSRLVLEEERAKNESLHRELILLSREIGILEGHLQAIKKKKK